MKELSIEEKARAYDKALKVAQRFYNNSVAITKKGLEDIFPELAESEDERIIKAIKSAVLQLTDIYLQEKYGLKQSDCIAWLEKQGETFTKKDVDDAYIKGICDAKHEFEKQGEQKPNFCHHEVDLSDCSEEYRKAYYDGWNNCNMQHSQCNSELEDVAKCLINGMKFYYEDDEEATWGTDKWSMPVKYIIKVLEKQCEQKPNSCNGCINSKGCINCENGELRETEQNPAWSEQDEKIYNLLYEEYKNIAYYSRSREKAEDIPGEVLGWLKSLKERVQPQQQEWSEDERKVLDEIINDYEKANKSFSGYQARIDWLKSLRPKSQWKPSEEQMMAIDTAINVIGKGTINGKYLVELHEQLKKLKG